MKVVVPTPGLWQSSEKGARRAAVTGGYHCLEHQDRKDFYTPQVTLILEVLLDHVPLPEKGNISLLLPRPT